jgi:GH24 family phage-related lysozyme (muramidase)
MKVSITEEQYKRIQSKLTYESVLDDLVYKLSFITEDDGKTEPDMEWDFTKVKEEIDLSKMWVKTKEQALEYLSVLKDKIKSLPSDIKKKILRYVLISFLGLLTFSQIEKQVDEPIERAVKTEKEVIKNITKDLRIRKSSEDLLSHLKWEEGSIIHKGEPVLTAYNLGDGAYTVGYGHAIFPNEQEGYNFLPRYDRIIPGRTKITKVESEILLKDDIKEAESIINRILDQWEEQGITPPITQGMYDAMVSMAYNMGPKIRKSDFIQYVKQGDFKGAKEEILNTSSRMFNKYPGLKIRREKEAKMFV